MSDLSSNSSDLSSNSLSNLIVYDGLYNAILDRISQETHSFPPRYLLQAYIKNVFGDDIIVLDGTSSRLTLVGKRDYDPFQVLKDTTRRFR